MSHQARRNREAREKAAAQHWQEVAGLLQGLDRLCNPPPPDFSAQRIVALEAELAFQADQAAAAAAERARSAKYYADQRAAIAKREAGGR